MQEHIGKKRKRELREASSLLSEQKKKFTKCVGVFGGAIAIIAVDYALAFAGVLSFDNIFVQVIPLALIIGSLLFAGSDITRYSMLKREYQKYCAEHSITEDELKAFSEQA